MIFVKLRSRLSLLLAFIASAVCVMAQPNFINKIPIPPMHDMRDFDTLKLEMRRVNGHKFNPANPADTVLNGTSKQNGIETWCYNLVGDSSITYLGPTLKWHSGEMNLQTVTNRLPQATTTHWHGAELPVRYDGGPHQPIGIDETWPVEFKTLDSASTMWYHPHYHDNTYPHVSMGLSGMIYVEQASDVVRETLPRTYGVDDIPVIIQDLKLRFDSASASYHIDTLKTRRPTNIVNGVSNPYLELPAHWVRLRLLNGSSRKGEQIGISESYSERDPSALLPFILVGTDAGYVTKPDTLTTLLTGPGERLEILLDLSKYVPGDVLYLRNLKYLMHGSIVGSPNTSAGPGSGQDSTMGEAFLQLRIVADPQGYEPVVAFTEFTKEWDKDVIDTVGAFYRPEKRLIKMPGSGGFSIDSTTFDMMRIDDIVCEGALEIWTIKNESGIAHPFHIHKIFFRILDIDSLGKKIDLASIGLNGPKDDVLILPNWRLRFIAKFDDFPTEIMAMESYMYHCHILTHEDSEGGGMMHQFVVTNQGPCDVGASVSNAKPSKPLQIFPNPTSGEVNISGESEFESTIQVVNLQGKVVLEYDVPPFAGKYNVITAGLNPGMYQVKWTTTNSLFVGSLIVNR